MREHTVTVRGVPVREWLASWAVDGCGAPFEAFDVSGESVQLGEALRALVLHAVVEVDHPCCCISIAAGVRRSLNPWL